MLLPNVQAGAAGARRKAETQVDDRWQVGRRSVLIVEDQRDVIDLLQYHLERESLEVLAAGDAATGLDLAIQYPPDLVIAAHAIDGVDGLALCRQIRVHERTAHVPIILLSTQAEEIDRVLGLEMGADDYMAKPFSIVELTARVRATLRRSALLAAPRKSVRHGELAIDGAVHRVTAGGAEISLTPTEFRILSYLSTQAPRVVSRDDIIDHAIGADTAIMGRAIDVHISTLRRKLGAAGEQIQTVRGFGYRLNEAQAAQNMCL